MADPVKELLSAARASEARGDVAAASAQYEKAGFPEEAARVLMARGENLEAGRVYLRAAGQLAGKSKADADRKRLLRSAAVCLARGGDARRAAELFASIGDAQKAAEVLERAGDSHGASRVRAGHAPAPDMKDVKDVKAVEAARAAHKLGRFADAAKLYEQTARFFEAAVCWAEAGDKQRYLDAIVRSSPPPKMYRACCVRAIAYASELNAMTMELDQLVTRFAASAPENDTEVQAFVRLGKLYEDEGFTDSAQEVYRKLLAHRPDHPVKQRLARLDAGQNVSQSYSKILDEDLAFMGKAPARATRLKRTGVDPLAPDLPPLPAREPRAAPAVPVASTVQTIAAAPAAASLHLGELQPGDMVAERYRIEAEIGQGGMAAIFRALDTELDDRVALKVFTLPTQDPEVLQRFKQELAVARKLSHPNVVRLHDIGVHRGCRFITMELLSGEDLGKVLARERLTLARALELLSQACAGLQVAHDRGVIHRDIKPENLFLTDEGVLKVMDFGIAKDTNQSSKTRTGMIAGTPAYMSPEQITGFARVTPLTDVYALGIVAYQMCTGDVPFSHAEMMPTLMMHVQQPPEPPKQRNPQIPEPLNALILRLLEKDPERRVQSCRELATELDAIRSRLRG